MLEIYCSFRFSVSSSFLDFSACSNLSTNLQKSISGFQVDVECDAFFFIAHFVNFVTKVLLKTSVIFVFL